MSATTDAQQHAIGALDDVAEHVAFEFDPDNFQGISTCGFAHIGNVDGRSSFVKRVKALASNDDISWVYEDRNGGYRIEIGAIELSLRDGHRGWRLSLVNVSDLMPGPEMQRMDVRERLHTLVLERLQYEWDYLSDARVYSRMD